MTGSAASSRSRRSAPATRSRDRAGAAVHPLLAHRLRAAVCARVDAGRRPRPALAAPVAADRALHGLRAHGGDAFQSAGRLGDRSAQSPHRRAASARAASPGHRALRRQRGAVRLHHRVPESALPLAFAGRAGDRLLLLGDQAVHGVQPLLSRPGALGFAGRRMARGARRFAFPPLVLARPCCSGWPDSI